MLITFWAQQEGGFPPTSPWWVTWFNQLSMIFLLMLSHLVHTEIPHLSYSIALLSNLPTTQTFSFRGVKILFKFGLTSRKQNIALILDLEKCTSWQVKGWDRSSSACSRVGRQLRSPMPRPDMLWYATYCTAGRVWKALFCPHHSGGSKIHIQCKRVWPRWGRHQRAQPEPAGWQM